MDNPTLLADIGGTTLRFARGASASGAPAAIREYRTAAFASLEVAVHTYLADCPAMPPPHRAAFATANPVAGDTVHMTNLPFSFSVEQVRRALDLDTLLVVNDFTALALGIPRLAPNERTSIGPEIPSTPGPIGVIGPGTGLGMSALVPVGDAWLPLSSEGGHASFAPSDAFEAALLQAAWKRHAHVSLERLLSGPGLRLLYELVCELHGVAPQAWSPADIVAHAQAGTCAACRQAVACFCNMLGTCAGDLALTIGARGGIYIGGGVTPKLGALFDPAAFRARFEDKGRLSTYLARIPTYLITAPYAALAGLDALLTAWRPGARPNRPPFDLAVAQR